MVLTAWFYGFFLAMLATGCIWSHPWWWNWLVGKRWIYLALCGLHVWTKRNCLVVCSFLGTVTALFFSSRLQVSLVSWRNLSPFSGRTVRFFWGFFVFLHSTWVNFLHASHRFERCTSLGEFPVVLLFLKFHSTLARVTFGCGKRERGWEGHMCWGRNSLYRTVFHVDRMCCVLFARQKKRNVVYALEKRCYGAFVRSNPSSVEKYP